MPQSQVSLINKHAAPARVHGGRLSRCELSHAPESFYLRVSRVALVFGDRGRISPDDPERRSWMGLIRLAQCDEREVTSWLCWPGHVTG